jgi:hypothetical protein
MADGGDEMTDWEDWAEWHNVRLMYNGSDVIDRKPSIDARSWRALQLIPEREVIEVEVRPIDWRVDPLRAEATRNSKDYVFMRQTRLLESWPDIPNEVAYEARYRRRRTARADVPTSSEVQPLTVNGSGLLPGIMTEMVPCYTLANDDRRFYTVEEANAAMRERLIFSTMTQAEELIELEPDAIRTLAAFLAKRGWRPPV